MQHEAALLHDRATFHDGEVSGRVALFAGARFHSGLFQHRPEVESGRAVDDETHRPVVVVREEIGDRAREVRILKSRHGDEEVVGEVHAHHSGLPAIIVALPAPAGNRCSRPGSPAGHGALLSGGVPTCGP